MKINPKFKNNIFFLLNVVLDAWGSLPKGILSGNLYSFGAFSQCFRIERNEQIYRTQYCLARIIVDAKDFLTSDKLPNNTALMELRSFLPIIAVGQSFDIMELALPR